MPWAKSKEIFFVVSCANLVESRGFLHQEMGLKARGDGF